MSIYGFKTKGTSFLFKKSLQLSSDKYQQVNLDLLSQDELMALLDGLQGDYVQSDTESLEAVQNKINSIQLGQTLDVVDEASKPNPVNYKGLYCYVSATKKRYWSNGESWQIDVGGSADAAKEVLLPRLTGLPLLRAPKDLTGLNVIGAGVTQRIVTRNGRRAWEVALPATAGGNFTAWFSIPQGTYNHKIQAEIEVEDALQFNGGSVQVNVCESNAFTQARRHMHSINSAAGWNGIHQIAAADSEWVTVGAATWGTISSAPSPVLQIKFLLSATANKSSKVWIYEVIKDEKDNLPMIILGADDGHATWYNDGLPILEKYGLKSYLAYIADPVGTTNYMTLANWKDAVARGHEVIVHGCKAGKASLRDWMVNPAPYPDALTAITAEIQYNRDSLVANGLDPSGIGRKCYIYPQGFHQPSGVSGDTTVLTALKNLGFECGRLAAKNGGFTVQPSLGATIFHLPILGHWYSVSDEAANITAIIAAMNTEIAEGRSVILMFHIVRSVPTVAEDISPANLDKICAAIATLINQSKAVNGGFGDLLGRIKLMR